jgi:hypothetical protein
MAESYHLDISYADLRVIAAALRELPYRIAHPVIERLVAQTEAQDRAEMTKAEMTERPEGVVFEPPVPEGVPPVATRTPTPEEFREAMRKRAERAEQAPIPGAPPPRVG